jgi:uncharacterized protein YbaR (Trm112 family)/RNA polymerase subunit RPABC4/transcription elongation factor Spt4
MHKRGPYKKNKLVYDKHKDEMIMLRMQGYGYKTISKKLGISQYICRNWTSHIKVNYSNAVSKGMLHNTKDRSFYDYPRIEERKNFLIRQRGYMCEGCKLSEWMGKMIVLELHNHNNLDTALLLCPNCHSQTSDWRGRGKLKPK